MCEGSKFVLAVLRDYFVEDMQFVLEQMEIAEKENDAIGMARMEGAMMVLHRVTDEMEYIVENEEFSEDLDTFVALLFEELDEKEKAEKRKHLKRIK